MSKSYVELNCNGVLSVLEERPAKKKDKMGNYTESIVLYKSVLLCPVDGFGEPLRLNVDDTPEGGKVYEKLKTLLFKNVSVGCKARFFNNKLTSLSITSVNLFNGKGGDKNV